MHNLIGESVIIVFNNDTERNMGGTVTDVFEDCLVIKDDVRTIYVLKNSIAYIIPRKK